MNFTTLTQQQYEDARYQFLLETEEAGTAKLRPYVDSRGFITIGVGFNLHDGNVRDMVLAALGIQNSGADALYFQQLSTKLAQPYLDPVAGAQALRDLDTIMSARNGAGSQFGFRNEPQVKSVFATLAVGYEALVNQKAPGVPAYAQERVALYSIAYNTKNGSGLGWGLKSAITSGNRAEAWFEIRYNTNPASMDSNGIAKRRYYEAQKFGLYNSAVGAPTADDAKQIYAMLARHRDNAIFAYEALYGTSPDSATNNVPSQRISAANTDYSLLGVDQVQTLTAALTPARDALIAWVNTQLPVDETPLVASDWNSAAIAYNSPTQPMPILDARSLNGKGAGMDKNLLVGNDTPDYLIGGTGADVLIGGKGDDFLQGSAGDDTVYGGEGLDTYVVDLREGMQHDRIVDVDGNGRIMVLGTDGNPLNTIVLQRQGTTNTWKDKDGIVTISHNSPWVLTLSDGSVIELGESFDPAGFGISLQDAPGPTTGSFTGGTAHSSEDRLLGSAAGDLMQGLDANDLVTGASGGDVIDGGLGDDLLLGGLGADAIQGGGGADWIFGSGSGTVGTLHDPAPVPGGATVIARGYGWVVYNDTNGTPTVGDVAAAPLAGDAGNVIDGGAGNDNIDAGTGHDLAHGGDNNDTLYGLAGNDLLYGDAGNDVVFGDGVVRTGTLESVPGTQHGSDVLVGGAGTDNLYGDGGNDEIYGGDDSDYLYGDQSTLNRGILPQQFDGSDYVDGGAGADWMEGGQRDDMLFGGIGNDTMFGDGARANEAATFEGQDYLDGEDGDDVLAGGGNADDLFGGNGSDQLWGDNAGSNSTNQGQDYLDGEAGNDDLIGGGNDDELLGGDGDDRLWGDESQTAVAVSLHGRDYLDGGAGGDQMVGGGNDDELFGGDGDDNMVGDDDVSNLAASAHGADYMEGGAGNDDMQGSGGDDILLGGDGDDFLVGEDQLTVTSTTMLSGNDALYGEAGNDALVGGAGDDTLDGGEGNDALYGGAGNNIHLFGRGDGQDVVQANFDTTAGKVNTLLFKAGVAPSEVLLRQVNNATESKVVLEVSIAGTNDKIALDRFFYGKDPTNTYNPVQRIKFADGTTWDLNAITAQVFAGTANPDNITGTTAADAINGQAGADYLYGGDGDDTLNGGADDDYLFGENGSNTLLGGAGDDHAYGSGGADTLDGGTGNDYLEGGLGDDTYLFGKGDGYDTIYSDYDAAAGKLNLLQLKSDVATGEIAVTRSGYDLVLAIAGTTDKMTVNYFFYDDDPAGANNPVQQVKFATGAIWDTAKIMTLAITGDDTSQELTGYATADTINAAGGNDHVNGRAGNDTLEGGAGADYLSGGNDDDVLRGGTDNDTLYGDSGADNLDGGTGNDELIGGSGNDTYLFGKGDGHDIIKWTSITPIGELNTLEFKSDVATSQIAVTRSGSDLVLSIAGTADKMTVINFFYDHDPYGDGTHTYNSIQQVKFASGAIWDVAKIKTLAITGDDTPQTLTGYATDDIINAAGGNDSVYGQEGNDTLDGGTGNDYLSGGLGNDTYMFGKGDGLDVVSENWDSTAGIPDTLQLKAGLAPSELALRQAVDSSLGGNIALEVSIAGTSDKITLNGFFYGNNPGGGFNSVRQFKFADGTTWDLNAITTQLFAGTAGANTITGTIAADTINGQAGADVLSGRDGNDVLNGGTDNDTLYGENGNDTLDGGTGNDSMTGGTGDDTYMVSDIGDVVNESADAGTDAIQSSVTWTLGSNVENLDLTGSSVINGTGNTLDNVLNGNSASNTLTGGAGNDTLNGASGSDTMIGGTGDDSYVVDLSADVVTELAGEGTDTVRSGVSWTLGNNLEYLTLLGTSAINGTGNPLDNLLTGNSASNTLTGGAGNDTLDGATGTDTMIGGLGDDTYVVYTSADTVTEAAGEGTDTVNSAVTLTLGSDVENLTLAGTGAINGTGNSLNNVLTGNASDNVLGGGAGADILIGGAGNDVYIVDNAGDVVTELAGEGSDTVKANLTWALGTDLENLVLTGTLAINGTGNALDNALTGNAVDNVLAGGAGNDTLNAGLGINTMAGGAGDDVYVVNVATDTVTELAGEGIDRVKSALSWSLGANLENLLLTGTSNTNGTGNTLDNTLTGNAGGNRLDGGIGADAMSGGAGDDTYVVDNTGDSPFEAANAGIDQVESSIAWTLAANFENLTLAGAASINGTGNSVANTLTGNTGSNRLNGAAGADAMIGGAGDDTYVVDDVGDSTTEGASAGIDTVETSITRTLGGNLENLTLTGTAVIDGTGNALVNTLRGNVSDNVLSGGAGADILIGSAGNDIYIVDNAGDVVNELAGEGADTVKANLTWALGTELENLVLTGSLAINGTGNALDNALTGNAADNVLAGGAGNDTLNAGLGINTMAGGTGDDVYVVNVATDTATELAGEGTDRVKSALTWALGANLEHLTLTGTSAINGTGNSLANSLIGNAAGNLLAAGEGNDIYDGAGGADTFTDTSLSSNDTYRWGIGSGLDSLSDAGGALDHVDLFAGVAKADLRFAQNGNNLEMTIAAQTDKLTIANWFLSPASQIEEFRLSDGSKVLASEVQSLVGAMAAFSASASASSSAIWTHQEEAMPARHMTHLAVPAYR